MEKKHEHLPGIISISVKVAARIQGSGEARDVTGREGREQSMKNLQCFVKGVEF